MSWNRAKDRQQEAPLRRIVPAPIDNRHIVQPYFDSTCKCHGVSVCPAHKVQVPVLTRDRMVAP